MRLHAIDEIDGDLTTAPYSVPVSREFLQTHPTLMVDTRNFGDAFRLQLLGAISDLDEETDGLLINSENFQALSALRGRYQGQVSCVYIDPPYNTDATPIAYKNDYAHSSWLALIEGRVLSAERLMADDAILCVTIDDAEIHRLRALLDRALVEYDLLGQVPIKNNPAGRTGTVGFSICHEYGLFLGRRDTARVGRLEHSESQKARYKERDEIGSFEWTNFRKHGGLNTYRVARPRQFYPIYVRKDQIRFPAMSWDNTSRCWDVLEDPLPGEEVLLPIDDDGRERIWDFVVETARENLPHLRVSKDVRGRTAVYRKWRLHQEGMLPQTWWDKSQYSAAEYGTNLLADLFGETHSFSFPKSLYAVMDSLRVANLRTRLSGVALDYFAGSGTTGHAVINLNREDGGRRKFILIEMGDHFDRVLVPRIKKVTFTPEWKDGKPKRMATPEEAERSPRIIKILRLESYEDTLNNLELKRSQVQQDLLDQQPGFREDYMLRYMLDVESQGSASLLALDRFEDPFSYQLDIATGTAGETKPTVVDLVETFNYLIGLHVKTIDHLGGVRVVTGTGPDGERVLVLWRKTKELDSDALDAWFATQGYNTRDQEFDVIYVNGDNNLENLRKADQTWKVRLIEEEFQRLMFDVKDV